MTGLRALAARSAALAAALALWAGCDSGGLPPEPVEFDATVQLYVINDGPPAYVLDADGPGRAYYPLNLPAAFQEEGARAHVEGLLVRDYEVLLLPPVEIAQITRL